MGVRISSVNLKLFERYLEKLKLSTMYPTTLAHYMSMTNHKADIIRGGWIFTAYLYNTVLYVYVW